MCTKEDVEADCQMRVSQSEADTKVLDAVAFLLNMNVAREHRMRIPKNQTIASTSKSDKVQAKSQNTSPR